MPESRLPAPPKTGYPPGLLQDDCRGLSRWLSNRVDSRLHAREAAAALCNREFREEVIREKLDSPLAPAMVSCICALALLAVFV